MSRKYSLFSYKSGNSFLHKCPSWIKLLFIPAAGILLLVLPWQFSLAAFLGFALLGFMIHISAREQFTDIKPVFFYAVLLCVFQILTLDFKNLQSILSSFADTFSWNNQKETVLFLLKLTAVMQSASLLFKTSTSLELREGINLIESRIRIVLHLKRENTFSELLFMFLNFIPMISGIWQQLSRAWLARGGKNGIKMYVSLLPVLFYVSMKKAWNLSRAIDIRKAAASPRD